MHINKDNWDYISIYENRKEIIKIIKAYFGNKISNITIEPLNPDFPDNKVGIEYSCILYKTFYVKFYVLRGFDFKIMKSDSIGITLSNITPFEKINFSIENETIQKVLKILDEHLKLQLPDKYLKHYGWL